MLVLDLGVAYAGPLASAFLVALGATVLKVENPGTGGDMARGNPPFFGRAGVGVLKDEGHDTSLGFLNRNRGKLSMTLDLKNDLGRAVLFDLVERADVLLENYSSGLADRMGIGYDALSVRNPRLIYCSISGRGQDAGPSELKAFALMIEALSGLMDATGEPGAAPTRIGIPIGDILAPLFGVVGILSALHRRERTGRGDHIDVAMLDALTALVAAESFDAMRLGGVGWRTGNSLPRLAPFGCYPTSDGHVAICAPNDAFTSRLLDALGRPDLANEARFRTRDARALNYAALDAEIGACTARSTTAELMAMLERADIPAAPVRSPIEAVADPGVVRRRGVVPLEGPDLAQRVMSMGMPIRFHDANAGFDGMTAPALGEHTRHALTEILGYSEERIVELTSAAAFGPAPRSGV